MAKKFQYYDIRHLFKDYPDAYYYLVYGERSNGKTYSALDYAVDNYIKTGEQFAYLRRYGEDIRKKNLSNLFSGHIENGRISALSNGAFNSVDYTTSKFYLQNVTVDEDGCTDIYKNDEPMGFAFDLNSMEHYKSTSFPKITTIIFDEFMSRTGYLPNEWVLFANTLSTIIRHRNNVKIVLLGNTVNKYCPYFSEMGLSHIKEQKPGTVDVYNYADTGLKVICEYTPSSTKKGGKASDVYFAFDNPELKMITSGSWEIAIYPHLDVKIRPKDIIANFFIEFNDELLHGEVISLESGPFIFLHAKTTPIKNEDSDIVYTSKASSKWNYKMCLTRHTDKLTIFIMKCVRENKIFYSTNEIGETFRNYLIWSDQFSIKR